MICSTSPCATSWPVSPPSRIDDMSARHGLAPTHPEPWKKILTAGSDDKGGMSAGNTYTQTPAGRTTADFFRASAGRANVAGRSRRLGVDPLARPLPDRLRLRAGSLHQEGEGRKGARTRHRRCWKRCSRVSWKGRTRRSLPSARNSAFSRKAFSRARSSRWRVRRTCRSGTS